MKIWYFIWDTLQLMMGGSVAKQKICREVIGRSQAILEVGCATGNLAQGFVDGEFKRYVGIDIDRGAIDYAAARGLDKKFEFYWSRLQDLNIPGNSFDCILLAGFFHHIPDEECVSILNNCSKYLAPGGRLVLIDPLKPLDSDPWLFHFYDKYLEKGKYVRDFDILIAMLKSCTGQRIVSQRQAIVTATPWLTPKVARFCVVEIEPS